MTVYNSVLVQLRTCSLFALAGDMVHALAYMYVCIYVTLLRSWLNTNWHKLPGNLQGLIFRVKSVFCSCSNDFVKKYHKTHVYTV